MRRHSHWIMALALVYIDYKRYYFTTYLFCPMHRTHTCWELRTNHVWSSVTLAWRADDIRELWWMAFVTLRDRYGVTQIQVEPDVARTIKPEYCLKIVWDVGARPAGQENKEMDTGEIELKATSVEILNTCKELPFPIRDNVDSSEEYRFKHRFLDIRRKPVLENIKFRAKMNHFTRNWFTENEFLEVQTPILANSSPEWARDFLVPSRIHPGTFFALPQAPQQFKQLLMMGWVDKYFQIAPCFRDEDPRADRHTGAFYQVDLEMTFVEQQDVLNVLQAYGLAAVKALVPHKTLKFGDEVPMISFQDSMDRFGIDRPDLRIPGMEIVDLSEEVGDSKFGVFANTVKDGWLVRAINLKGKSMTRKELDATTAIAKQAGAGWLAYMIIEDSSTSEWTDIWWGIAVRSPIAKFFSPEELTIITKKLDAAAGDILFFGAGDWHLVCKVLNKVRMYFRDIYEMVDDNELAFCFIIDFPFYEYDDSRERRDFWHNPFSHVVWWLKGLEVESLHDVKTNQYDFCLNWYELGSWSIRNHDPEVMVAAFKKVWLSEEDIKKKFGAMYEAFQFGCPPHGGFAFWFDRFMMIMCDEPNIREVYAFPKSNKAEDLLMRSPSVVDDEQLEELFVKSVFEGGE